MRRLALLLPLALVPLVLAQPAEQPAPRGYVCHKAVTAPAIDGKLDDAAWKAAPWSDDFVDIEGDKKPKPRFRTRMKMLWDDKALYIAAEMEEPHVWATYADHDSVIFHEPDFEVFLDPDGDNHLYGELELNAKNTTWDLLLPKPYRDGGPAINGWEIIGLKTAVHVDGTLNDPRDKDVGWTVEIAWPWAGVKELHPDAKAVPPRDGDAMRINFSRVEWDVHVVEGKYVKVKGRPEHNWVWSPQGVIDMHRPERWGRLQFSTKAEGPVRYLPDPDQDVKDRLHAVYYAQKAHLKANRRYARGLGELALPKGAGDGLDLEPSRQGFTVTGTGTSGRKWHLAQDSRLWGE